MKKADVYKHKYKINRNNNTTFSHRVSPTNILTSDLFGDSIWLQNNSHKVSTGVQIVELRSSDSDKSERSVENKDPRSDHQWSYAKQNKHNEHKLDDYDKENGRSREQNNATNSDYGGETSDYDDDFCYAELFVSGACDMQNDNVVYNQVKCFTILDKHMMNSETSDDDYGDIELIDCADASSDWTQERRCYANGDVVACAPDSDNEKRTVWIYSYKNKRLLADNDFELVNIPSQDSNNSSIEDYSQSSIENCINRASTPLPIPHVPRLNLPIEPTLPTLSEVTEPERLSAANQTDDNNRPKLRKVVIKENNWFLSEQATPVKEKVDVPKHSTSIVNWMALSPREKKRKFRNTSPINLPANLSGELINHLPTKDESSMTDNKQDIKPEKINEIRMEDGESSSSEDYVKQSRDQSTSTDVHFQSSPNRSRRSALESAKKSIKTFRSNLTSARKTLSASIHEARVEAEIHAPEDRGDHGRILGNKPRIQLSGRPKSRTITSPLENIESDNWIYEEKLIKDDHIRTPTDGKGDRASQALWVRSMPLLKPAEWSEYLPIAELDSLPSLHLSMNTDSIEENRTWYRCCFRRVFKWFSCCK